MSNQTITKITTASEIRKAVRRAELATSTVPEIIALNWTAGGATGTLGGSWDSSGNHANTRALGADLVSILSRAIDGGHTVETWHDGTFYVS